MNKLLFSALIFALVFNFSILSAQKLRPGFEKEEYIELLSQFACQADTPWVKLPVNKPMNSRLIFRSKVVGLSNRCDLWLSKDSIITVNFRGTVGTMASWLSNLYTAMSPANGSIILDSTTIFPYQLSNDSLAAVHSGWLISLAFLSQEIKPKLDSLKRCGFRNLIISGHSQGGAIAFLFTSWLYYSELSLTTSERWLTKTYCSAAPKPGNLYYAYDFEFITRKGFGFNVINTADWVPQTPFSCQTLDDYNYPNPFIYADTFFEKASFFQRIFLKKAFRDITSPPKKTRDKQQRYLGHEVFKFIKKIYPQMMEPKYANTSDFTRAGDAIILKADKEYYKAFQVAPKDIWTHHLIKPYLWLTLKYYAL